jgi:hypothetical protein
VAHHLDLRSGKLIHFGLAAIKAVTRSGNDHSVLDGVVFYSLHRGASGKRQKGENAGVIIPR